MSQLDVLNPYSLEKITSLPQVSREEAFAMLERADQLFQNRDRWLPKYKRIEILEKAAKIVASRVDELAKAAAEEGGKPLKDSIVEVNRAVSGIKVAIHELHHLSGKEIPMGLNAPSQHRRAFTTFEPRGVVMAISAFNHPFNLIVHQVVPAIAVGCPVLVKPASSTPISCKNLLEILYEAGLPQEWAQFALCKASVAEELVSDTRTSFLTFIGSAKIGWHLRSKLPPGATCALEHGGVAPVIMDASADFDKAIPLLTKGGFYHAGQVCVSVQRVYVPQTRLAEFTEKFTAAAKELKVGSALDPQTDVGPLIDPKEVERVDEWVQEAIKKGGKLLLGGKKISDTVYAPTIIENPSDDAKISQQEVFGPVVLVYSYRTINEAIERANALPVSFQAAVFSQDIDAALKCTNELNALAVMVNDHTAFRVDWMPFGGTKQSGLGFGGIGYTMEEMCNQKLTVFHSQSL